MQILVPHQFSEMTIEVGKLEVLSVTKCVVEYWDLGEGVFSEEIFEDLVAGGM